MKRFRRPGRIPLVDLLIPRTREEAKATLLFLCLGAVTSVEEHHKLISMAENILFNPDVLTYCKEGLRDNNLADIIAYGMELAESLSIGQSSVEAALACGKIEGLIKDELAQL